MPRPINPLLGASDELQALSPTARAVRLEWLLQGVLEIQSLTTEADFDLEIFMQRTVDVAESLTGARGAVVELVEGDQMLYRAASAAIQQHVGLRLRRESSLSGLCVTQKQILLCDETETDPRVDREACRKVGVRSMICVPLFQNGEAIGVLKVMGHEPAAFDSNDQYLLNLLAGALGAALGRQVALEALKTSEETFRSAMETSSIGMALVKPNGHFVKVNAALCKLLGYEAADLLANDVQSITHPEDRERDYELMQRTLQGELQQYRVEKRYYHRSGSVVWVQLSAALVRDEAGDPRHFVVHIQDLTEQREIDRMKGEFISMISHELRTPVTSIRGSLGLILGTLASALPEKVQSLLTIAQHNAERLVRLIDDVLDIDKMAAGKMRYEMKAYSIAALTARAVELNEAYAARFKARIVLAPMDQELQVSVDEARFIQVLSNLLSNAAKFSPPGGDIAVRCDLRLARARISVADQGPGIPENFRSRIFGKFSQADSSQGRQAGGTGLGLHIARQMVEQMQGQIGFDTAAGRGTTFWIEFPLSAAAPVAPN